MSEDANRWRYEQIQDYLQSMMDLLEADKKEFESREQEIKSTVDSIKDKFLPIIALATTIFLGLASLNIFKETMIVFMMIAIIVGIIWYGILNYLYNRERLYYGLIKASKFKPVLRLVILKEIFMNLSVDDTEISEEHLKNVFVYVKLVGMSKFEQLEEFKRATNKSRSKGQQVYFKTMSNVLEGTINDALSLYSINRDIFRNDERMDFYELQLASFFGGETLFEQFERILSNQRIVQFKSDEYGLSIEIPDNWVIEPISEKIKKLQKLEKTILKARPLSGTVGRVSLTLKTLDISNSSVYPTKSLSEIVKFQKGMLDPTMDTVQEDVDITINQHTAHKIVYISRFRTLIDKVLKIWLVVNEIAYEISYEAPNALLYDAYYDNIVRMTNTLKILD